MWDLRTLNTDKPLYIAIADALERDIKSGELKPGDRLPTHRELAKVVGVNVTTATRGYQEAEKRGLVTSVVGNGTFVATEMRQSSGSLHADVPTAEYIEMGLVLPLYALEPELAPILEDIMTQKSPHLLLQYTPPQGLLSHRQTGARWLRRFGMDVDEQSVIILAGAQHGTVCIFSSCFAPGDRIAIDNLSYPGIKSAAKHSGIRLEGVKMDREGMLPDELEKLCKSKTIKGVYTTCRMQNPTNACMSEARKQALVQVIKDENLLLIEDDQFGFLCEGTSPLFPSLPDRSIYLVSTARAFYPGLRTAFVVAPPRYYNKLVQSILDTIWMSPTFSTEIACTCIESGVAERVVRAKRIELAKRAAIMAATLASDFEYEYMTNSMFAWLKLPADMNSFEFEKTAYANKVKVAAANKFTVGNMMPPNYIRVSLSGASNMNEFKKGLYILVKILNQEWKDWGGIV